MDCWPWEGADKVSRRATCNLLAVTRLHFELQTFRKLQSLRFPQIRLLTLIGTFPLMVKVLLYLVVGVVRVLVKSLCSIRCVNNKEVSHSTCDGGVRDAGDR